MVDRLASLDFDDPLETPAALLRREHDVRKNGGGAGSDAGILLVGEAAGYRGARVSGVPFTSERQLTGDGPAEATATIVQGLLIADLIAAGGSLDPVMGDADR